MRMPTLKRFWPWRPVSREATASIAILGLLLAASSVSPSAYRYHPREDTTLKKVFRTLQKRGLNREAAARQTAGYYEGLLDQAASVTQVSGRSWLDWRFWLIERAERADRNARFQRTRDDFLRFDLLPNVDFTEGGRRTVTNSMGMMDQEYSQRPPEHTWRIALVGDSVSAGVGFGTSYETKLEEYLNQRYAWRTYERYEILNFSVPGYQLTQLVEVGLHRVPPFSPDVYLIALTERSVFSGWADHVAGLVRNGMDLKYDFLRHVAADAKLTPNLSAASINARLAPYRGAIFRWALGELEARARRDDVPFVVLLLPTADDPEIQIEQFDPVKRLLGEMSITTVDLLDTFAYLDDVAPVRVSAADKHPNREGHQMLFEAFIGHVESDARLRNLFTGATARESLTSAAGESGRQLRSEGQSRSPGRH